MKKYSMIFFIKQSLNGLFKNGVMSLTSVFILTSCLILMGCFGLLIYNININLDQLNSLNKVIFYIKPEYNTDDQIAKIKDEITALSNTKTITFISSKEALDTTLAQLAGEDPNANLTNDADFYSNLLKDAPSYMKASIEIEYNDINDVNTLIYQLNSIEGVDHVKDMTSTAETIKNLKNVVMLVLVWFLVILFIIAIFIILNTVKLSVHSRKEEIIIMRYIGSTNFFILIPFLLEGIIIGLFAGVISYFLQWYIYKAATTELIKMQTGLTAIKFVNFSDVNILLFVVFIIVGVGCGLLGSSISSHRYLKA
ncbi:MAG: permease-like cell division protein FtsX [Oscillospiraceae bacterium]|nr:permease-like cell division protein FtsX [Oscillospiraceae bacterium]